MRKEFTPYTIEELLCWMYANLAAYQVAMRANPPAYSRSAWMVRARLYKGLMSKTMTIQSIYINERHKLSAVGKCAYCDSVNSALTLDHLFPRSKGGSDSGDNLVYCCRSCNSSKGTTDYFAWIRKAGRSVSVEVAERYIKNAYQICCEMDLLHQPVESLSEKLPFEINELPKNFALEIG